MSLVMRKPTFWFPTWSDTNQAVQLQKMAETLLIDAAPVHPWKMQISMGIFRLRRKSHSLLDDPRIVRRRVDDV